MISTILFDLDGTLLPMDQDTFIQAYMGGLTAKMIPHGYDAQRFMKCIWKGTGAMVINDGAKGNEEVFWDSFCSAYGQNARKDEPVFLDFYQHEFQQVRHACGFEPKAAQMIHQLKKKRLNLVLATNPLFPAVATYSRIRWAGLAPEDFSLVTTYENSRFCKPNLDYYRSILDTIGAAANECLMVGNDVSEDMIAGQLGMQVFLLTDCLINKDQVDIDCYPHGSFEELMVFIGGLTE